MIPETIGALIRAQGELGKRGFLVVDDQRLSYGSAETRSRRLASALLETQDEKQALVQDPATPFFTTPHFDGHPSVLVRASRLGEVPRDELVELVQEAWLSRASRRRAEAWLAERGLG